MFIYWIRYNSHTDPYKEGYIGISNKPSRRLKEHFRTSNGKLLEALNNGAKLSILFKCESLKEAKTLEEKYRPSEHIGWNIVKGGGYPPLMKDYDFSNSKNILLGENRTDAQKKSSKRHSELMKSREICVTPKGGTLSDAHRRALRKPKSSMTLKNYECPHCGKSGRGNSMRRWHFDHCKSRIKIEAGA